MPFGASAAPNLQIVIMDNSKGSIILKVLSSSADEGQISAYLEKRSKSIPPEKIPALLKNLPVVLSRNVVASTAHRVIRQLEQLGAEAFFIPLHSGQTAPKAQLSLSGSTQAGCDVLSPQAKSPDGILPRFLLAGSWKKWGGNRSWMKKTKTNSGIILSMLGVAWVLSSTIAPQQLVLGFCTLPTILSAYYFGRGKAILTACANIFLAGMIAYLNPTWIEQFNLAGLDSSSPWYLLLPWGCILLIVAYTTGTLHEKHKNSAFELRQAYQGLLLLLRHFTSQNESTDNHCFRVSIYAARIASSMGLEKQEVEDIRSAALLHDIDEFKINRDIFCKATQLNRKEQTSGSALQQEEAMPDPMNGSLGRILPILLGHNLAIDDRHTESANESSPPLGARILAVADAYDTLTSATTHRQAMAPSEARDSIVNGSGKEFAPEVVDAFTKAYDRLEMDLPSIIL